MFALTTLCTIGCSDDNDDSDSIYKVPSYQIGDKCENNEAFCDGTKLVYCLNGIYTSLECNGGNKDSGRCIWAEGGLPVQTDSPITDKLTMTNKTQIFREVGCFGRTEFNNIEEMEAYQLYSFEESYRPVDPQYESKSVLYWRFMNESCDAESWVSTCDKNYKATVSNICVNTNHGLLSFIDYDFLDSACHDYYDEKHPK